MFLWSWFLDVSSPHPYLLALSLPFFFRSKVLASLEQKMAESRPHVAFAASDQYKNNTGDGDEDETEENERDKPPKPKMKASWKGSKKSLRLKARTARRKKLAMNKRKNAKKKASLPKPEVTKPDGTHETIIATMYAKDAACKDPLMYKAGEYGKIQKEWIKTFFLESAKSGAKPDHAAALAAWSNSLKRAMLLSPLGVPELKKRRFVQKGCETNPFKEVVQKAFSN